METIPEKIARRLYNNREALKSALGDGYDKAIGPWKDILHKVMEKCGHDNPLEALLRAIKDIDDTGDFRSGYDKIKLCSACLEILEDVARDEERGEPWK